eukprot:RCo018494
MSKGKWNQVDDDEVFDSEEDMADLSGPPLQGFEHRRPQSRALQLAPCASTHSSKGSPKSTATTATVDEDLVPPTSTDLLMRQSRKAPTPGSVRSTGAAESRFSLPSKGHGE